MNMKRIADRIVESVDDCFQLGAQAVEINRRGDDEHFGGCGFLVDDLHVIFLAAFVVFAGKARIATDARIDFIIVNRNDLNLMLLRSALHERFH